MLYIILGLIYIISPILITLLCKNIQIAKRVGAVLISYFVGIAMALVIWILNINGVIEKETSLEIKKFQSMLCDGVIPLAIPMMLFSSNYSNVKVLVGNTLKTLVAGIVATVIIVVVAFFLFKDAIGEDTWKVAGLVTGVETGGTPNMAALQMALKAPANTYMLLNIADMIICFLYLLFLFSVGKRFFSLYMKPYKNSKENAKLEDTSAVELMDARFEVNKKNMIAVAKSLGVSIIIAGISLGLSFLFFKELSVPFIMLCLTTISIATSFIKSIRTIPFAFDTGIFLVLIFSMGIASMVDFSELLNEGMIGILGFIGFSVFGTLLLHSLFCKFLKIDVDTFMVSSCGLINSPPFVPSVAAAIGNKKVIVVGITVGILGYAIGNYLGFSLAYILRSIM